MMASNGDPSFVLYVDHQGHPAPLTECFHATASRRLSSTVDRQRRPSTVTQVDSAYCPQCLSFHDASSASQLGYCPKPSCLQCPLCTSIVSCNRVDSAYCYVCGRCEWKSTQCNLQVDSTSSDTTKEDLAAAVPKLFEMLLLRREASGQKQAAEDHFKKIVLAWEGAVKPQTKSSASRAINFKENRRFEASWSVDALEASIKEKQELAKKEAVSEITLQRTSLDEEVSLDPLLDNQPIQSFLLQALTSAPTRSMSDLLPLAVPLRSRKSRRCRAELAEGKPGILLKPKLNPLEGDSSLRTGHGQWWKKDSSAIHVVPRVRVASHGSTSADNIQHHAFLLKVSNPTLGLVRLQIGSSNYDGEPFWDDQQLKRNTRLENLLIESQSSKHLDTFVLKTTSNNLLKSELVELDSAEDTIVDIGKVKEIPKEVTSWKAEGVIMSHKYSGTPPDEKEATFVSIDLLAKLSGSAWFQVICAVKGDLHENQGLTCAVPITLLIEVGNGSWESSLIKTIDTDEGKEPDLVSFDLLLTLPSSTSE